MIVTREELNILKKLNDYILDTEGDSYDEFCRENDDDAHKDHVYYVAQKVSTMIAHANVLDVIDDTTVTVLGNTTSYLIEFDNDEDYTVVENYDANTNSRDFTVFMDGVVIEEQSIIDKVLAAIAI